MRKNVLLVIFVSIILVGSAAAYYIKTFDSDIRLNTDGSYEVTERIVVDFGTEQRHGIYRDIPYKYDLEEGTYTVRLKVISVTDDDGDRYKTKISKRHGYVNIRIGSPNIYVSGVKTYIIRYKIDNAMLYFDDYDELYWNVTGTGWSCDIERATATVHIPIKMPRDELQTICFTGSYGSDEKNCVSKINDIESTIEFWTTRSLGSMEGLTIGLSMPKGFIREPSFAKKLGWLLEKIWPLALLPIGLIWLIIIYLRRGRDPLRFSIVPRYEAPEELTPAEAGTLIDESVDMRDMTSTIVDLAVRGYLKIVELEKKKIIFFTTKDYILAKLKEADDELRPYEKRMFNALFDKGTAEIEDKNKAIELDSSIANKEMIAISSLKEKFYTELPDIKKEIYESLMTQKLFPSRPDSVRSKYTAFGIIALILSVVFTFAWNGYFILGLTPVAILIIIFGRFMPRKTKKGSILAAHVAGFEEFVRRVEKDRIERMANEDPTIFERLLPYAMALGVADQWADAFKDIFKEPPDWYVGQRGVIFTPHVFVNNLGSAVSSVGSAMSSRPRGSASGGGSSFGGGGFSGGGFGGGGGGAW